MGLLFLAAVLTIPVPITAPVNRVINSLDRVTIAARLAHAAPASRDYNAPKFDLRPDFQGYMRVVPPSATSPTQVLPHQSYSFQQHGRRYDFDKNEKDFGIQPIKVAPNGEKRK